MAYGECSPLDIAVHIRNPDIQQILVEYGAAARKRTAKVDCLAQDQPRALINELSADCICLVSEDSTHPGAGSWQIDGAISEPFLREMEALLALVPEAGDPREGDNKRRSTTVDRHFFCDSLGIVANTICGAIFPFLGKVILNPYMRFISYGQEGSKLGAHVDLPAKLRPNELINRVNWGDIHQTGSEGRDGELCTTTHTWVLYLHDCDQGGQTLLLESLPAASGQDFELADGNKNQDSGPFAVPENEKGAGVLASVRPKRGRILVFPHQCPHMGAVVVSTPKTILRGECLKFS